MARSPRRVGGERAADKLAGVLCGSNPAKATARDQPREGEHNLREEPCAVKEEGEQEQIRSCGSDQGEADAPVRV